MRSVALAPILLAIALIAATCNGGPPPTVNSGIEGNVTIGPMCPVEQPDSPCPDEPYPATIVIHDSGGGEVARTESDEDGRFRIALVPGSYTLAPLSPDSVGLPFASEQQVEVRASEYTQVKVEYDSGIR